MLFAIKMVAFVAFVAATNRGFVLGSRSAGGYVVYFALWSASLASLVHVAFFGDRVARVLWSVLVVLSALVGASYQAIFDKSLTLVAFEQLLALVGFIGQAFQFYGSKLAALGLLAVLGLVALNVPPSVPAARSMRARLPGYGVQLAPVLLMVGLLYAKNGQGTNGLATAHTSLAFLATLGIERLAEGSPPPRQNAIAFEPAKDKKLRRIVLVMDESIRGDLLDVNRPNGATTGLAGRSDVVSFGVMSSIANCSLESNVSVRYGVGRAHYLRQLKVNPSVFTWAAKAGYATHYFDAQRSNGLLQNGMDEAERGTLTGFVQVPESLEVHQRDVELAKALRRTLDDAKDTPVFAYVNKMGAHYPYEGKYPTDQTLFEPVIRNDFFGNEKEAGCGCHCGQGCRVMENYEGKDLGSDVRQRFKNSYLNAVSWNTRRFFEIVLDGLDLSETLVVYTADHGQYFHEDGRAGLNTHCTPGADAHPDEGKVPLAIVTGNPAIAAELRAAAERNRDRLSQFSVFPSVLLWMGYAREDIRKVDVDPLIDEPPSGEGQRFLSTFFTRAGAKPVWTSIRR